MKLDLEPRKSLKGKRVLVTGGSQGIGRALVEAFLKEGAKTETFARTEKDLEGVRRLGAFTASGDVSKPEDVRHVVDEARKALGGLDAVVNNAAVFDAGRLAELPLESWHRTLAIDLTGPLLVIRAAAPHMDGGAVVNITSGLSRFPMSPYGAYCTAKAGLDMMTQVLAEEFGERMRLNLVDPGGIRTRMNPTAPNAPEAVVPVVRALILAAPKGPTGSAFDRRGEMLEW
jgi:NAD(P)-dependent dehydrogenase (short-subunit alcohol dehydrogenase family)